MPVRKVAVRLAAYLGALLFAELAVRITGADVRSLYETVYIVEGGDIYANGQSVYRDSKDTERLYELVPDTSAVIMKYQPGGKPDPVTVHINQFGMRDIPGKRRSKEKQAGVFRIIVVGSSQTFGFGVNDNETYPARMEEFLEKRYPGRFEVWNAGVDAYVLSQKIAFTRQIIDAYQPDLIILKNAAGGRRAFLYNDRLEYFFRRNRELFVENIPLLVTRNDYLVKMHRELVRCSGIYRFLMSVCDNQIIKTMLQHPHPESAGMDDARLTPFFNISGEAISKRAYENFMRGWAVHRKPGLVFINRPFPDLEDTRGVPVLKISIAGKPAGYALVHPVPEVYKWYGEEVCRMLISKRLIPAD